MQHAVQVFCAAPLARVREAEAQVFIGRRRREERATQRTQV